ncbi:PREDICTED: TNFAIP3-interacting protein 1 isoform X1 [Bison bison bison]|uniref:TNFAIP3-interacting protein 1 n=1 Tax=Bison bison bison TaxID=43346 RepID=A0A6P3I2Y2_BISBB|nr:PREDICTED: TNFAIP3-interacting protein 1 isoform X1 [Bison bison bison]XP_010848888.1 PREDICTED: TNFAIP3-interacting protein 1 isoform X1 [Bison bison bison]XP_010848889.1 PREDICTED: TNFAIP3-interacting protein 1 isoform X1 [Bison bison bison]XP_010848890.1 PREDICTED: TNFAIP3-interacting protein 1 isoform X1 [Bison bison bison]
MEGRGPYRIYDPGGGVPLGEASSAFERLVEENSRLKEKMQGIKMLGELLEESQMEASRLRQKAEELVKDSEPLPPSSPSLASFNDLAELAGKDTAVPATPADPAHPSDKPEPVPKPPSSNTSSEFEVVPAEGPSSPESSGHTRNTMELGPLPQEDSTLMLHLQRLETTLSVCAEEPDHSQLFTHLGRMALEFNRLASKVHKNEQRTSILQTLCEQLRKENEALKSKLDKGLEQRDQAAERLREENLELRKLLMSSSKDGVSGRPGSPKMEGAGKKGAAAPQQTDVVDLDKKTTGVTTCNTSRAGVTTSKIPEVGALGAAEKKVRMLEQQRTELLEVNKQWDQHFRSMKQQYEQKITELRQKLADLQKQVTDLEAEREQKQRDFDRKLLLAKSKIEMEETDREHLTAEAKELRQKVKYLQDQLSPLTRQREYQEKEIQRLNKALEEALSIQASPSSPTAFGSPEGAGGLLRKQELLTQNELLKQQVKIFEEDFQRERSDRERMNEEKEELKKQVEKLQAQVTLSHAQLKAFKDEEKAKDALRQQKRKAKTSADRYHLEPHPEHLCGACPYAYPPMPPIGPPPGFEDWSQIRYPPPPTAMEHPPPLPNSRLFRLPEYTWRLPCGGVRNQSSQVMDLPTARPTEPESTKNDREGPQ